MNDPGGAAAAFDALWSELEPIGRSSTGGYRRFAWTEHDATLREWFTGAATDLGLDVVGDRAGNLWAWWGDPDAHRPGLAIGSHLDSVPEGGAFDGPLGVVSALVVVKSLRARGFTPPKPIAIACFGDEEGARFGIACAGSRLLTGALDPDRARSLRDADGTTMAEAMHGAGFDAALLGRDDEALRRVGTFVELHVEQGKGLVRTDHAVAVGSGIWPHGRWRIDLAGRADHAGTTRLPDRSDPMLDLARLVTEARTAAERNDALATVGKVVVHPNGVNAIPSSVTAWLDCRADEEAAVRAVLTDLRAFAPAEESWTDRTAFHSGLQHELSALLALPAEQQPAGFFNGWTRKEAFIKATGAGLSQALDAFSVTLAPGDPARIRLRGASSPRGSCTCT